MVTVYVSRNCPISTEERDLVEVAVRGAIGPRPLDEEWIVALLRPQSRLPLWTVSIQGPQTALQFVVPPDRLIHAIRQMMSDSRPREATADVRAVTAAIPA
jgi:hypothetical protein